MRTMKHIRLAQQLAKQRARAVVDGQSRTRSPVFSTRIQPHGDLECEANAPRGPFEPNQITINR